MEHSSPDSDPQAKRTEFAVATGPLVAVSGGANGMSRIGRAGVLSLSVTYYTRA